MPAPWEDPPSEKRPLGPLFHILFWSPLAITIAALVMMSAHDADLSRLGGNIFIMNVAGLLLCALVCSVMIGRRHGAGLGVLVFIGMVFLYGGVAFGGCLAVFVSSVH